MLPQSPIPNAPVQASSSSFRMAMQILPARQREAMFAIYAFCRAVDDVADGAGPAPDKRAALERWRNDVDACYAGVVAPRLRPLAPHIAAYALARPDFHAVIDGMLMDAQDSPICAPPADLLDLYCDRVAGAVGRLSVRVFGMPPDDGMILAHHLGRALQLTNILRDIDEDAAIGRAYLPYELLDAAGVEPYACSHADAIAAHPALPLACDRLAAQAQHHYAKADAVLRRNSRPCTRAPRLMGAVYQALLARLAARGWGTPRATVKVGRMARVGILLRHALV